MPFKFEAFRKLYCGSYSDFIASICRTTGWEDNAGGKSGSSFFKSQCEKYIIKEVNKTEMKMFEQFAGMYFDYLCKSFFTYYPTCLAKILGAYRIKVRSKAGSMNGKVRFFFIMENLFVNWGSSKKTLVYDLKGSMRNRFLGSASGVKLDNNFSLDFDSMPLPLDFNMYQVMNMCFANDSLFLSKCQVIDYSLLLVVDLENQKLRVGIIDYI